MDLIIPLMRVGQEAGGLLPKRPRSVIIIYIGDNMIRTQVSLDEQEYRLVKEEARTLGISVAEYLRRALREALPPKGEGAWMRFAGLVETGDSHSSESIDEIVYGSKD